MSQGKLGPSLASIENNSTPRDAEHAQLGRRIFIGPMPHRRLTALNEEDEEQVTAFVRQHGLRLFLKSGGNLEDWTEAKAREYKERLLDYLEHSVWHVHSKKRKKGMMTPMAIEWSGDTFEIGKVVGVSINMLTAPEEELQPSDVTASAAGSADLSPHAKSALAVHWDTTSRSSAISARASPRSRSPRLSSRASTSFITAPQSLAVSSKAGPEASPGKQSSEEPSPARQEESATSSTALISRLKAPSLDRSSSVQTPSSPLAQETPGTPTKPKSGIRSILTSPSKQKKDKGKNKAVSIQEPTVNAGDSPAPPEEVLRRSPEDVQGSSAAAAAEALSEAASEASSALSNSWSEVRYTDTVLRDRMLVRVYHTEQGAFKRAFDETECRITRGLEHEEWAEFLVIWREGRIELYEDYRLPCMENYRGHKHLAFVIPVGPRTKLSAFSMVDLSFSILCPPQPTKFKKSGKTRRSIFHRKSKGLNVFIFKHKSRSRAVDWFWNLWCELGGTLPPTIEVSCPLVHTRVSIPIPEGEDAWRILTRDYIIDQCTQAMEDSFAWQTVIQMPVISGKKLELCWRSETSLDWVWLKDDVDGNKRDWEALFGIALQHPKKPAQMELRLANHYPTQIILKNEKRLEEPPAVEGFVHTFDAKTQRKTQFYLSTHDGYLFTVQTTRAVLPPSPSDLKNFSKGEEALRKDEASRLRLQIINSKAFWDLRNVLIVRRASHIHMQRNDPNVPSEPIDPFSLHSPDEQLLSRLEEGESELRRSDSDIEDEGGETGLAKVKDKPRVRMHRSFELVLKNGRILRFETYSTKNVIEWVSHLRALLQYWQVRRRADATTEMNLVRESMGNEKITVSRKKCNCGYVCKHALGNPPDPEDAAEYLGEYWHWCVLNGCRQIIKSGRLYIKGSYKDQYTHSQLILVSGYLVQFKVTDKKRMYNKQCNRISLLDVYVCSGYYAAKVLPEEEYNPNAPAVARIYADGLETKDVDDDTIFMLVHRYRSIIVEDDLDKMVVPELKQEFGHLICRARSRLERDAWCWAINCEIEKLVRKTRDREKRARERGMPI